MSRPKSSGSDGSEIGGGKSFFQLSRFGVLQAGRDPEALVAIVIEVPSRRWTDKASDFREIEGERETERDTERHFFTQSSLVLGFPRVPS